MTNSSNLYSRYPFYVRTCGQQYEPTWYFIWAFAVYTHCRNGELYALKWSDINFDERMIAVQRSYNKKFRKEKLTKSGDWRHVSISDPLWEIVLKLKTIRDHDVSRREAKYLDYVLPRPGLWQNGEQAKKLRLFCEEIGITPICFHTLRACFATELLKRGVSVPSAMRVGGWSSIETMMHYLRPSGVEDMPPLTQANLPACKRRRTVFFSMHRRGFGRIYMLYDFLLENKNKILSMTEKKSLVLAGVRPSSDQLKRGLPIFYQQLLTVLKDEAADISKKGAVNTPAMIDAAKVNDEPALAKASGQQDEVNLTKSAGGHGVELLRLGYTLSHVVHAYGAMCQSITECATDKNTKITPAEFHDLNRCLDAAIAGAVTEFQALRNTQESSREVEHLGFLAHELRNALGTVTMSLDIIKDGTVGFKGSVGKVLDRGLLRIGELIDRSLTEVRLRVDPNVYTDHIDLLQLVDQIVLTANIEAKQKNQTLEIAVDPNLTIEADQQLIYSAVSNLVQNALKYTRTGGRIQIRGKIVDENIIVEVEDECGGLTDATVDLFKPFEQQNENRKGLGLGLTIAQRAIVLSNGTIGVQNLPQKGCVFKISLPNKMLVPLPIH